MVRSLIYLVAMLALVSAAACQSAQPDRLDGAINSYESKNWQQSLEQASVVQNETSGAVRDQAAFLAGLSAYQLGNYPEAQTRFHISEQSMDAQTAGESKVMLGDLMVHKKRYGDAANYYDAAANKLSGETSKRAKELAVAARDPARAGNVLSMPEPAMIINGNSLPTHNTSAPVNSVTIAAKVDAPSSGFENDASAPTMTNPQKPAKLAKLANEKPAAKPAKPTTAASTKTSTKGAAKKADPDAFVINAGSFILETSAKNRAKEISKAASRNGIEAPNVVASKSKGGQKIWIVYVGEFETRAEAEKAIKKLGRKDLVVVANPK
ncbi:MAG: SPOR domain-containing protein [Phycisphaerales bacterium]|nr:SPOR domain-containing protein [Phycisphaerales bacterium]